MKTGGTNLLWLVALLAQLSGGGFCGFRNFVPGAVCVDYLKVYRKK